MNAATVRRSVFHGSFYPGTATEIRKTLDALRQRAGEQARTPHPPILMIPHAGWAYSGLAAVQGLATLVVDPPARIAMIGPAHRHYFMGFSISGYGAYETPLGTIDVDLNLHEEICDATGFSFVPEAHQFEHSLEVIIPMIQHLLPGGVKILPMLAGSVSMADVDRLADALAASLDPFRDVLVISTDLSHFFSYEEARKLDRATLDLILDGDDAEITRRSGEGGRLCCGYSGVVTAIALARKWHLDRPEVLIYFNSGDSGGDKHSVVGYGSVAWPSPKLVIESE
jgi:hypothetical protein